MGPNAYHAGRVQALHTLGLVKTATSADQTALGKAIANIKELIPKTKAGKGALLGALIGLGLGARSLNQGKRMALPMEPPLIHRGSALTYEL